MPNRPSFQREYEGSDILADLLAIAGSAIPLAEVEARFRAAQEDGTPPNAIIPTLFPAEPRFPDPSVAQRLFQNLLGLWDLIEAGEPNPLDSVTATRPKRPTEKPPPALKPDPFGVDGPDDAFVEIAWKYLDEVDRREGQKLEHAFENREDALLAYLDEQDLSDHGYSTARHLLFELFAMIQLGWPSGSRSVLREELEAQPALHAPAPLQAYADEGVYEAEQDDESPLSPEEAERVRQLVKKGLGALWNARKP